MLDSVDWYIDDRVLIGKYSGVLTASDVREAIQQLVDRIESSTSEDDIHIIQDLSQCDGTSRELSSVKTMMNINQEIPPHAKLGWIVVIDPKLHRVLKVVMLTVARIFQIQVRGTGSMKEAIQFLTTIDESLSVVQ